MKLLSRVSLLAIATASISCSTAALADVPTSITPDTAAGRDLNTSVSTIGNVTTIDNGTLSGTNLFHSFANFDLGAGDVAQWVYTPGNASNITNVVSRVTGGSPSSIAGMLDSTALPNADFYFVNPAGIIFGGQGAQVNVPAAAYFSTASELRFANGETFSVTTPGGSTLSMAAPSAFGFLGNEGDILIHDVGLGINETGTDFLAQQNLLNLSGSQITIVASTIDHGGLVLAATGSQSASVGLTQIDAPLTGLIDVASSRLRSGFVDGFILTPDPIKGAPVTIAGGSLLLTDSVISTLAAFGGSSGDLRITLTNDLVLTDSNIIEEGLLASGAGNMEISAANANLTGSLITSLQSYSDPSVEPGRIDLNLSGALVMRGSGLTTSRTDSGNAGEIKVTAGSVELLESGGISSFGEFGGSSGDITLSVDGLLTINGSVGVGSTTGLPSPQDAHTGDVTISAHDLVMIGGEIDAFSSDLASAGQIYIDIADSISMAGSARIVADSIAGSGGDIFVRAQNLTMTTGSAISVVAHSSTDAGTLNLVIGDDLIMSNSRIVTDTTTGTAGAIALYVGNATLTDNSAILSRSYQSGNAGTIDIQALGAITLLSSFIQTSAAVFGIAGAVGDAGSIVIEANTFSATNSYVSSEAVRSGNAGLISLTTLGAIDLNDSSVSTSSFGNGNAGNVWVRASDLALTGTNQLSRISSFAVGNGDGGMINVAVDGHLLLDGGSEITAASYGAGQAGNVDVYAASAKLAGVSRIGSDAKGSGDGGTIFVAISGLLDMDQGGISTDSGGAGGATDFGDAGQIAVNAGELRMRWSGIDSTAYGDGAGGFISVVVDGAVKMDSSSIGSNSFGSGDAGSVFVDAASLTMIDVSDISSDAIHGGNAGLVLVRTAQDMALSELSRISSNAGESGDGTTNGNAGAILIEARNLTMNNASIYSISFGAGFSGLIDIGLTGQLDMTNSIISSDAFGATGIGGNVFVRAISAFLDNSSIGADTYGDGDAGSIAVDIDQKLTLTNNSYISSSSQVGTGNGGDVSVTATDILLNGGSLIYSVAYGDGDGGIVDIVARNSLILDQGSEISTDISGAGFGGAIAITAPNILLSGESIIASTGTDSSTGDAGDVSIKAGRLTLTGGSLIASDAIGSGASGFVTIEADDVVLSDGGTISTKSMNENPAGAIFINSESIALTGVGTSIASENLNPVNSGANSAGSIDIAATRVRISEGARVSTNSLTGAAGNISFQMPSWGLLILDGVTSPGVIETSSGSQNGGVISISNPLAIISNGGRISALGQSGGANVQIDTNYFIVSSDRLNTVEVDGTLAFTNAIYDVSSGTVDAELTIVDASGVLRNQCSAARSSGELSQLQLRPIGPFGSARKRETRPLEKTVGTSGGCH